MRMPRRWWMRFFKDRREQQIHEDFDATKAERCVCCGGQTARIYMEVPRWLGVPLEPKACRDCGVVQSFKLGPSILTCDDRDGFRLHEVTFDAIDVGHKPAVVVEEMVDLNNRQRLYRTINEKYRRAFYGR